MKALCFFGNKDLRYVTDYPAPQINADNEIILDVAYCGICGSDLHEYLEGPIFAPAAGEKHEFSGLKLPQPMGHEFSGVVREVGKKVTKVKPGDHVVCTATIGCGDKPRFFKTTQVEGFEPCTACKKGKDYLCVHLGFTGLGVVGGAFAEQVLVSDYHTHKIPDSIPLDVAALVEPLAVSWHAVAKTDIKSDESALILGSGPIGLACILALQARGVKRIIVSEPSQARREQALKLGVDPKFVIDPMQIEGGLQGTIDTIKKMGQFGDGVDYSFDCSGVPATFTTSVRALMVAGTAINVAIWPNKPIDAYVMDWTMNEKCCTGSSCYGPKDFDEVIEALSTGKIDLEKCKALITGRANIKDGLEKGFNELLNHKDKNVKILLTPKEI